MPILTAGGGNIFDGSELNKFIELKKTYKSSREQPRKSSKARRYGRIIKQYDQAIKELKSGGQPDLASLPDLPNMAPIPGYAKKELTLDDAINAANAEPDNDDTPSPAVPSPKPSPPKVKSPPRPPPQL